MARKKTAWISPLGESVSSVIARRIATNPNYAALVKKYEVPRAIARRVILYRGRTGLTQQQLAKKMGTTVSVISRLESGRHLPGVPTLERLAQALGGKLRVEIVNEHGAKLQPNGAWSRRRQKKHRTTRRSAA